MKVFLVRVSLNNMSFLSYFLTWTLSVNSFA